LTPLLQLSLFSVSRRTLNFFHSFGKQRFMLAFFSVVLPFPFSLRGFEPPAFLIAERGLSLRSSPTHVFFVPTSLNFPPPKFLPQYRPLPAFRMWSLVFRTHLLSTSFLPPPSALIRFSPRREVFSPLSSHLCSLNNPGRDARLVTYVVLIQATSFSS